MMSQMTSSLGAGHDDFGGRVPGAIARAWLFVFQAEGGIRGWSVTGVQTCALPIFYVRRDRAAPEHERRLLSAVVEMLTRPPYVTRIETQLMMLSPGVEPFPGARFLKTYERNFMKIGRASGRERG